MPKKSSNDDGSMDLPEGFVYVDVEPGESLNNLSMRLRRPVNVIADNNPDTVNRETGVVSADSVLLPEVDFA